MSQPLTFIAFDKQPSPPPQPLKPSRHRKCRSRYHMQIAHGTFVLFPANKIQKTSILLQKNYLETQLLGMV